MALKSLKTKLIFTTCLLIIIIISALSSIFILSRVNEYKNQIYLNARSFAEIVSPQIANINTIYLQEGSFLSFNKEIKNIFNKNSDIATIKIFSYQGTILYDSLQEKHEQYQGPARTVTDQNLLTRLKSQNQSLGLSNNSVVFLKIDNSGAYKFVSEDGNELIKVNLNSMRINNIIEPFDNRIAVEYGLSYKSLDSKIRIMIMETIIVMLIGLILGVIFSYVFASTIVRPLKHLTQGVLTISEGDFHKQVPVETKDEVGVLAKSFNQMAIKLDQSTKAMVFQERVAKEFELAADIQRTILPKDIPNVKGLDIAAGLIPAEAIGGDLFDFIKIDDDNLMFYLGDVTGHGVPSSLVVSIANAVVYSHIDEKDMQKILCRTNAVLKAKTLPNMFLTLIMMNWNVPRQKMTYVSAGHEQLIYFDSATKKASLLPGGGMALGMIPDISKIIKVQEVNLKPGDLLITYSDGIPECWKDDKELYGMDRFQRLVEKLADLPNAEAIKNSIIADVKLFANGYEQKDDITVIVVKKV